MSFRFTSGELHRLRRNAQKLSVPPSRTSVLPCGICDAHGNVAGRKCKVCDGARVIYIKANGRRWKP